MRENQYLFAGSPSISADPHYYSAFHLPGLQTLLLRHVGKGHHQLRILPAESNICKRGGAQRVQTKHRRLGDSVEHALQNSVFELIRST